MSNSHVGCPSLSVLTLEVGSQPDQLPYVWLLQDLGGRICGRSQASCLDWPIVCQVSAPPSGAPSLLACFGLYSLDRISTRSARSCRI